MADDTPGAVVARSAGAWVYFNADHIRRQIVDLVEHADGPIRTVVLDCSMVPSIDFNAASSLCDLAKTLAARGILLQLAELRDDVMDELRARDSETTLGLLVAHKTIDACLEGIGAR